MWISLILISSWPMAGKMVGIIIVYLHTILPHARACCECLYVLYAICKEVSL